MSVNEIFDPTRVSPFYSQTPSARATINAENRSTNYGVVRLDLIEHIYQTLYMQRINFRNEDTWPHRILTNSTVVRVDSDYQDRVRLQVSTNNWNEESTKSVQIEDQEYDAVILATGYTRDSHEELLAPARYLLQGGDHSEKKWTVSRDYKVVFEKGMVSDDAGVYLQGCNEGSHGVCIPFPRLKMDANIFSSPTHCSVFLLYGEAKL
jgi:L-ornithine N5-oxygenase